MQVLGFVNEVVAEGTNLYVFFPVKGYGICFRIGAAEVKKLTNVEAL
jgi:hypothetical protein